MLKGIPVSAAVAFLLAIWVNKANSCPRKCACQEIDGEMWVHCRYQGHTEVPVGFPEHTVNIDLSYNNLKSISLESFIGLQNLTILDLSYNSISAVEENSTVSLPAVQTLVLNNNKISTISLELQRSFPNIENLDLSFNHLTFLPTEAMRGVRLKICDFSHNNITNFTSDGFIDTSIESLDLSFNLITSVNAGMFTNLKNSLVKINLANNRIRSIEEETFAELDLKDLNVRFCDISHHGFLKKLKTVSLDLSGNNFSNFDFSEYESLRQLESFTLNGYDLEELSPATFHMMSSLKKLDLSNNHIYYMDEVPFPNLVDLQELILSRNQLEVLPSNFCENFGKLKTLLLNLNQLYEITISTFQGCDSLSKLDLRNNQLQVFPESLRPVFEHTSELLLSDNPMHCNCEMKWFKEWISTYPGFTGADFCATPRAAYIHAMLPDEFQCVPPVITYHTPNVTVEEGDELILVCIAEGDPPPEIDWKSPHGEYIRSSPSSDRSKNRTRAYWKLHDIHLLQAGQYHCTATSVAGTDTSSLIVTVDAKNETVTLASGGFSSPDSSPTAASPATLDGTESSQASNISKDATMASTHSSVATSKAITSKAAEVSPYHNGSVVVTATSTVYKSLMSDSLPSAETTTQPSGSAPELAHGSTESVIQKTTFVSYISESSENDTVVQNDTGIYIPSPHSTHSIHQASEVASTTDQDLVTRGGLPNKNSEPGSRTQSHIVSTFPNDLLTESVTSAQNTEDANANVATRSPYSNDGVIVIVSAVAVVILIILCGLILTVMFVLRKKQTKQMDYEVSVINNSTETICKQNETEAYC